MKTYNFDGHKLIYHIDRVDEFLARGDCFPIYMEISPVGSCNHRCIFCAYDYIGHPNRKLHTGKVLSLLDELSECGLKSVVFAGEGEPLMHPDIDTMVIGAHERGIDVGMFTNGQLLDRNLASKILPALTFIRFSFNGGCADNYAEMHRVKSGIFDSVLENIRNVARLKRAESLEVDIGAQYVLMPENIAYVGAAVSALQNAGVEYLAIKPFVQQSEFQSYRMPERTNQEELLAAFEKARAAGGQGLDVIVRQKGFDDYGQRNYSHCYGTSFISVLNSAGEVATCLPYWDRPSFIFGNINESTFQDIWHGERRKEIKRFVEQELNMAKCPPNCRANEANKFLFELKHPSVKHLNFI